MMKVYAVKQGRQTGIFYNWDDCKAQVTGFNGAVYKSFKNENDAKTWLNDGAQPEKKAEPVPAAPVATPAADSIAEAWVDGSFHPDHPDCFGAGVYYRSGSMEVKLSRLYTNAEKAKLRNVAGEMAAALLAVKLFQMDDSQPEKLVIYHDYEGVGAWPEGRWQSGKPETRDYTNRMHVSMRENDIQFVKVTAHAGIKGNELADALANEVFAK